MKNKACCFGCEYLLESASSYEPGCMPECGHEDAPDSRGVEDLNTIPIWCPKKEDIAFKEFTERILKRVAKSWDIPLRLLKR